MREQVDGHSLDAQAKNIKDYVNGQGWDLLEIYTDAGISAKKDSFRPDLARLMQDAEDGKFDVVVVDKIDRFYRHLAGAADGPGQSQAHERRLCVGTGAPGFHLAVGQAHPDGSGYLGRAVLG